MKKSSITKRMIASSAIALTLLLGACSGDPVETKKEIVLELVKHSEKYSEEKSKELSQELLDEFMSEESVSYEEILSFLNEHITALQESDATNIVEILMYTYFELIEKNFKVLDLYSNDLYEYFDENQNLKFDELRKDKTDDDVLIALLDILEKNSLNVVQTPYGAEIIPNFKWIESTFGAYIAEDFKDYLLLNDNLAQEKFTIKNDGEEEVFDYEVLAEKVIAIEDFGKKHPESNYTEILSSSRELYEGIYLGLMGSTSVDEDNKIKPELLEKYTAAAEEYNGYEFGKNISTYLKIAKENKNILEPETIFEIMDEIGHGKINENIDFEIEPNEDENMIKVELSEEEMDEILENLD